MIHSGYYHHSNYNRKKGLAWEEMSCASDLEQIFKPSTESLTLGQWRKLCDGFQLTKGEQYLLYLALLSELSPEYEELYPLYHPKSVGLDLSLGAEMYQVNFEEKAYIRQNFLHQFLFQQLTPILQVKPHIVDYVKGMEGIFPREEKESATAHPRNIISWDFLRETSERCQNISGHFLFTGLGEYGQEDCFFLICQAKGLQGMVVTENMPVEQVLSYALAEHYGICMTDPQLWHQWQDFLALFPFAVLVSAEGIPFPYDFMVVSFPPLPLEERFLLWEKLSEPYDTEVDFREFSNQYTFSPEQIRYLLKNAEVQRQLKGEDTMTESHISMALYGKTIQSNGVLGWEEPPKFHLSQLVLPQAQREKIHEALSHVREKHKVLDTFGMGELMPYGRGLTLLFVGPAGTGKTMCAYAIAQELKSLIYKVDLSTVVSKFIGETEKNLKKAFDHGRETQAILFFDEADVLFSKRTQVRDSADKYSNMESAFLLQEMEQYEGMTILATNLLQNMDDSFKRRMKFVIEFPQPSQKERLLLFQQALPKGLALSEDIDFDFLAEEFQLSGGNIKNILYNGSFLAAQQGDLLDMKCLLRSVMNEYEKMGKNLRSSDMGVYGTLWKEEEGE